MVDLPAPDEPSSTTVRPEIAPAIGATDCVAVKTTTSPATVRTSAMRASHSGKRSLLFSATIARAPLAAASTR
jgi:hypothetical protein